MNNWDNRKSELVGLLKYYEPEVFGIQEGLHHQLEYMDDNLEDYSRIGVGRDDGKEKGEYCAIFYNEKKFTILSEATFWLSENDTKVSVGWDASMERICTYGLFENKLNGKKILILNTHFDHIGQIAREQSSKLILQKIAEVNKAEYPVLLMGDFNAEPESGPITILKQALWDAGEIAANGIYGPIGTFTGFKQIIPNRRIDYFFIKHLEVSNYRHIDDRMKNNNFISDHLPVLVEFE
jgi:endonuclease/exonuclease/phosphatase family metal-dependent hydrolase